MNEDFLKEKQISNDLKIKNMEFLEQANRPYWLMKQALLYPNVSMTQQISQEEILKNKGIIGNYTNIKDQLIIDEETNKLKRYINLLTDDPEKTDYIVNELSNNAVNVYILSKTWPTFLNELKKLKPPIDKDRFIQIARGYVSKNKEFDKVKFNFGEGSLPTFGEPDYADDGYDGDDGDDDLFFDAPETKNDDRLNNSRRGVDVRVNVRLLLRDLNNMISFPYQNMNED